MNKKHLLFKVKNSLDHIGHSMSMPHQAHLEQEFTLRCVALDFLTNTFCNFYKDLFWDALSLG